MWTISLDPGWKNIGIAIFFEKTLMFFGKHSLKAQPQDIWGMSRELALLVSSIYKPGARFVLERNDLKWTKHFNQIVCGLLAAWLPATEVQFVYPPTVKKWMEFPPKTERLQKKKLTVKWVQKVTGLEIPDFDTCDAVMNFVYADCRFFSKVPVKRTEIKDATYRVSDHFANTIDQDEHRADRSEERAADPVPGGGTDPG